MFTRRMMFVAAALSATAAFSENSVLAGRRHGHWGWHGGSNYGSYSGSSYHSDPYAYNYNSYYSNPYSYEAQSLPYWMKPSYGSRSGGNAHSEPTSRPDRYGAIVYSRTTGEFGYSYNHYSRESAEQSARDHCPAADGEVIGWARNVYVALAVGDDVAQYAWWWSGSRAEAERKALEACQSRTTNCRIKVTFFTGN